MRIIFVIFFFSTSAFAQLVASPEQQSQFVQGTLVPQGYDYSHQFDQPVVVATINYTPAQPAAPPPTIPLGALMSAFQSPNRAQPPNLSDIGTEAGYMNSGYCPTPGFCGHGVRDNSLNGAGIYDGANQAKVAPNACMQKIVESGRLEAACWANHGLGNCATPPSPDAKYQDGVFKESCARAVASALTRAGINGGMALGNAKDMGGPLTKLGFDNELSTYPTPELAPIGSILIYGAAIRSGCRGAGSEFGHAEIKDAGEQYLSDGTAKESISKRMGSDCRPLLGVYIPKSVKNCG